MRVIRENAFRLGEYIDSFWLMEADSTDFKTNHFSNMVPEGIFELIFELGNPVQIAYEANAWQKRPRSFIGGLFDQTYELNSSGKIRMFGIRFKSAAMSAFTEIPLIEFKNNLVDIKNIFRNTDSLVEQINQSTSIYAMIDHCESFLIQKLKSNFRNSDLVSRIINKITEKHGNISIFDLCKVYSVSELKLRRLFYNHVGINPKTYCKINRLNYFLSNPKHSDQRLTKTTFDMGYFDQSHFIRDIKTVTGKSPKNCHLNYFQQQFKENPLQVARDL